MLAFWDMLFQFHEVQLKECVGILVSQSKTVSIP